MICRECGCTDFNACDDCITGTPCYWVEPELCSVCAHDQLDHNLIHELIVSAVDTELFRRCNRPTLLAAQVILVKAGNDARAAMLGAWLGCVAHFHGDTGH